MSEYDHSMSKEDRRNAWASGEGQDATAAKEDRRNAAAELPSLNQLCDSDKGWHDTACWDESRPCAHVFAQRLR